MYIVYMHTCPNGKKYIGITSQSPERRWQKGKGYAYGSNPYFYNAIEKYGWDNIEHTILFRNLTKEEAEQKEIELIKEHKTSQPDDDMDLCHVCDPDFDHGGMLALWRV